MNGHQQALDEFLSQKPYRRPAFEEICNTHPGQLISYGRIAELVRERHDIPVVARTIGWFRRELYRILTHDTTVPLHRVATRGDVESENDSPRTREVNNRLRDQEGSRVDPHWR